MADISTVARTLIDQRAEFAGASKCPFAPALARFPLTVMIAVPTLEAGAADEDWKNLATLPARWSAPKFPLKAKDFIRRGVERGPQLGAALAGAEQAWIAAGFPLDQRALAGLADAAVAATDGRPAGDGP